MVADDERRGVVCKRRTDGLVVLLAIAVQSGRRSDERLDGDALAVLDRAKRLDDGTPVGRERERDVDICERLVGPVEIRVDAVEQRVVGVGTLVGLGGKSTDSSFPDA